MHLREQPQSHLYLKKKNLGSM